MTESEIKAYIASEVAAQLQAITSKDIASESDVPTLSDAEWDTNNSITSLPVVYNGNAWRKIGAGFLRTLRNAAAVVSTAWNALKNNGTSVSWIPTVDSSGNAGKTSPADLAAVLGVAKNFGRLDGEDANNLFQYEGISFFDYGSPGTISNLPENSVGWGVVLNFKASNQSLQICSDSSNSLWYRTVDGGSIKLWKKFTS